jgi:hypothetical protein
MSTARISHLAPRRRLRFEVSDRAALLWCLAPPILLAVLAFFTAVALTAQGAPQIGTLRSGLAAAAYIYLALGAVGLPAYGIGLLWFWWTTRRADSELLRALFTMPLVTAAFVWMPSLAISQASMAIRFKMFFVFAIAALICGYLWAGMVRLVFYAWRRI